MIMIIMAVQPEQVIYGLLIGLPSFLLGYLAYRRARKVDQVAAQSGVATETRAGTTQIIEGLNQLIDNLQDDNRTFREDIKYLTLRLDVIIKERDHLRRELTRLQRKYGNGNGVPEGDLPN